MSHPATVPFTSALVLLALSAYAVAERAGDDFHASIASRIFAARRGFADGRYTGRADAVDVEALASYMVATVDRAGRVSYPE